MATDIKKRIAETKNKIASLKPTRDDWAAQLETARGMTVDDPNNAEIQTLFSELQEAVAGHDRELDALRVELADLEAEFPEMTPKFDPEKHPLLKKSIEKTEVAAPVVLNSGDLCEAFWTVDKSWYKAKILSILGQNKYHVKYLEYDETQTLDADKVRPLQSKRKREEPAIPAPVTSTPNVISGPASVNPQAQVVKPAEGAEAPTKKKRKVPSQKNLEKKVSNWKDFTSKGVGKKAMKESQFRSGTTVSSRVGFTGSGSGMTETAQRVRHDNKVEVQDEHDERGGASGANPARYNPRPLPPPPPARGFGRDRRF